MRPIFGEYCGEPYLAHLTSLDNATVVYVGADDTLTPALWMTAAPGQV